MYGELVIIDGPQAGVRLELHDACSVSVNSGQIAVGWVTDQPGSALRIHIREGALYLEPTGACDVSLNRRPATGRHEISHGDLVEVDGKSFVIYLTGLSQRGAHRVLERKSISDVSSVVDELGDHRRHLAAFYRILSEINLTLGMGELMERTLEVLMAELPTAERGFVFLGTGDGVIRRHCSKLRIPGSSTRVSRSILEEVLSTREAILARNMLDDVRFKDSQSIVLDRITTAMSAPFFDNQEVAGLLLIDSTADTPFGGPELELVTAVAGQLSIALERRRLQTLEAEKATMDRELVEAASVQQFLLPSELPAVLGCRLAVRHSFCERLGGDYYDVFPLDAYRIAVVVADVSGHSISSALVMAMTRSILRSNCKHYATPSAILAETNRTIRQDTPPGMFVTLFLAVLNTREMSLTFANAGHHFPVVYETGSKDVRYLESGGYPIGLRADADYPEEKIYLRGGDFLVVYTDGVVDAKDPAGKRFGRDRMVEIVRRVADPDAERVAGGIYSELTGHLGSQDPTDDVTILTLAVDPQYDSLFFEVGSTEESTAQAARVVCRYALDHGFLPDERMAAFRLMMREANANAIRHGNRGNPGKKVTYYVRSDSHTLRISVIDEGEGFDWAAALEKLEVDVDVSQTHGRGLFLICKYADGVTYNPAGNELTIDVTQEGFARRADG